MNQDSDKLLSGLRNVANKLRNMWGNNPDSDLIDQAVIELQTKVAAPVPKQRKTK